MKLPDFAYHRPTSVTDAVSLLVEHSESSKVLAGGQSLLPVLAIRLAQPSHLIDIGAVAGLDTITLTPDGVRIGAAVTQRTAERSAIVTNECPVLGEVIRCIGHQQTRARGTVCGSLAHADPAAELPALALALGASFEVEGPSGSRRVAAADFFLGFMTTELADDELVTAVTFPRCRGRRGAAVVEVSRRAGDFALVGAVCAVTLGHGDSLEDVRISMFGVADTPVRIGEAEGLVEGVSGDVASLDRMVGLGDRLPWSDLHATSAYRIHVGRHVLARALRTAIDRARSEAG